MLTLYDRFIPTSARLNALEEFNQIRYTHKEGAQGFFGRLKLIALRMPSTPDPYTMKRRLLHSFPEEMYISLLSQYEITAEKSTINEILVAATSYEDTLRLIRAYKLNPIGQILLPLIQASNLGATTGTR